MPRDAQGNAFVALKELLLGNKAFLRTDDGTELMNVNGSPAGTPTIVWNGTGVSDTGGDWTASGDGSETAGSMHSGTNGWDSGVRGNNDYTSFITGTAIDIQATSDSLSFWLNPQLKESNTSLRVRLHESGGAKGVVVIVDDYVANFDIGVWQKVTIPISDFGLSASQMIDEVRFQYQAQGPKNQQHYLDDIELNPTGAGGGPYSFQLAAPAGTVYHVSMMVLIVSAPSSGWNANTFANHAALENGLLLRQRRVSTGEILWSFNSKDNTDLFGRYHPQDDITFGDGTLLVGFMVKPVKATVKITEDDVLEYVVRDDLSSLTSARAFAHYGVEEASA
jgi:hypothetical protein